MPRGKILATDAHNSLGTRFIQMHDNLNFGLSEPLFIPRHCFFTSRPTTPSVPRTSFVNPPNSYSPDFDRTWFSCPVISHASVSATAASYGHNRRHCGRVSTGIPDNMISLRSWLWACWRILGHKLQPLAPPFISCPRFPRSSLCRITQAVKRPFIPCILYGRGPFRSARTAAGAAAPADRRSAAADPGPCERSRVVAPEPSQRLRALSKVRD